MRAPIHDISVDLVGGVEVRDLQQASIGLLRDIDRRQHAAMTGWAGPPVCMTMYLSTTSTIQRTLGLRVPPGVTTFAWGAQLEGDGHVSIVTSADATGSALRPSRGASGLPVWTIGAMEMSSSLGADTGRAFDVASSSSWSWTNVDATLTLTRNTGTVRLYAVMFRPIHVDR